MKWEHFGLQNRHERVRFPPTPPLGNRISKFPILAQMAELVYAQHLKCCPFGDVGSTPTLGTQTKIPAVQPLGFLLLFNNKKFTFFHGIYWQIAINMTGKAYQNLIPIYIVIGPKMRTINFIGITPIAGLIAGVWGACDRFPFKNSEDIKFTQTRS